MPRQTGLLRRKGRWYLNVRVPTDLQAAYGKKTVFRESLGTSDFQEAKAKLPFERFRLEAEFNEKRKEIKERSLPALAESLEIDDAEAHEIVTRFFIAEEKEAKRRFENSGDLTPDERQEAAENIGLDTSVFVEPHEMNPGSDGSESLDAFLAAEGLNIPEDSAAYAKLLPLFRKALIESGHRQIDRFQQNREKHRDPNFRNVFAHSSPPEQKKRVTLGEMLSRFFDWHEEVGHSPGTIRTYRLPTRLMREAFGETTPVDSITKEAVERFFKLLRRVPINATQRYPGMRLEEAVAAADKRGDTKRLQQSPRRWRRHRHGGSHPWTFKHPNDGSLQPARGACGNQGIGTLRVHVPRRDTRQSNRQNRSHRSYFYFLIRLRMSFAEPRAFLKDVGIRSHAF